MRIRNVVTLLIVCASLAAGLFTNLALAQCTPTFTKIDPVQVPGDATSEVTIFGSCLPTDISQVAVGFSDNQSSTGLPVHIRGVAADHITVAVEAPAVTRQSRRQLTVRVNGKDYVTKFYLRINTAQSGQPGQQAPQQGTQTVEYVTRPVMFAQIRKVDAKADRAIGQAQQAAQVAKSAEAKLTATQNAVTNLGNRFEQLFGADGNGGALGARMTNVEDAISDHNRAFAQIREEIDRINSRALPASANPEDIARLTRRVDELERMLQAVLHTRVKTGVFGKKEIGKAAGLSSGSEPLPSAPPPPGGGVRNEIQK